MWHFSGILSDTYIYIYVYILAFFLTFYLICILAFFLAFIILSDLVAAIRSGILSDIPFGIYSGILSGICSGPRRAPLHRLQEYSTAPGAYDMARVQACSTVTTSWQRSREGEEEREGVNEAHLC